MKDAKSSLNSSNTKTNLRLIVAIMECEFPLRIVESLSVIDFANDLKPCYFCQTGYKLSTTFFYETSSTVEKKFFKSV